METARGRIAAAIREAFLSYNWRLDEYLVDAAADAVVKELAREPQKPKRAASQRRHRGDGEMTVRWFAWRPVRLISGEWAWLDWVIGDLWIGDGKMHWCRDDRVR